MALNHIFIQIVTVILLSFIVFPLLSAVILNNAMHRLALFIKLIRFSYLVFDIFMYLVSMYLFRYLCSYIIKHNYKNYMHNV